LIIGALDFFYVRGQCENANCREAEQNKQKELGLDRKIKPKELVYKLLKESFTLYNNLGTPQIRSFEIRILQA
jgi:hypothetical protein